MHSKVLEKQKAIKLRRQGRSYKEIQEKVQVSKGTLSRWLSHIELTKREKKFLTERSKILQDNGRLKVALSNRQKNEKRREEIRKVARETFFEHCNDPFFVLGLTLYWADGARTGGYFSFMTSDTAMLRLMMQWVTTYLQVDPFEFKFRLYSYKQHSHDNGERAWSRACAIPLSQFQSTIYKPSAHATRKNPEYKGCMRMVIPGVNNLLTIHAWQKLLSEYYVGAK